MDNLKEALALGFELSGFIFFSYLVHKWAAHKLGIDENIMLTSLMGLSLFLWTFHAYIYFNIKK